MRKLYKFLMSLFLFSILFWIISLFFLVGVPVNVFCPTPMNRQMFPVWKDRVVAEWGTYCTRLRVIKQLLVKEKRNEGG